MAQVADETGVDMYASDVVELVEHRLPDQAMSPVLDRQDSRRDVLARLVMDMLSQDDQRRDPHSPLWNLPLEGE